MQVFVFIIVIINFFSEIFCISNKTSIWKSTFQEVSLSSIIYKDKDEISHLELVEENRKIYISTTSGKVQVIHCLFYFFKEASLGTTVEISYISKIFS